MFYFGRKFGFKNPGPMIDTLVTRIVADQIVVFGTKVSSTVSHFIEWTAIIDFTLTC